jgi:hypothetical protein
MNIILYLSIIIPIILLLVINFYMRYNDMILDDPDKDGDIEEDEEYISRENMILGIWMILIGFLGYAYYLALNNISSISILLLIIYSLSYPFITMNKSNMEIESLNIIYIIITYFIFLLVLSENSKAAIYILPLLLWIIYIFITIYIE